MTAAYLDMIRQLPCCVPGCRRYPSEPHHVRTAANSGTGMKPPDTETVPLCRVHHDEYHLQGGKSFEHKYGLDLAEEARFLASAPPMP